MAEMNEIVDKVVGTLGNVADKTKVFASIAADKAKGVGRIAKLTMEINGERDAIRKAYLEIGKLYYETHRDDPDGFFVQLCDEVTLANESIADKEKEIAELKQAVGDFGGDVDVEVEFETLINEEESCGCGCCEAAEQEPEAPAIPEIPTEPEEDLL